MMRALTRVSSLLKLVSSPRMQKLAGCCGRRDVYSTESSGRLYTKKHEWLSVKENVGTVGISEYAQEALGEIVFVQLPGTGVEVSRGDEVGALESVKAAGEVYTPVSGTITEKNTKLEFMPSLINKSCQEQGWLFRISVSKPEEMRDLMTQEEYDRYLEEQD